MMTLVPNVTWDDFNGTSMSAIVMFKDRLSQTKTKVVISNKGD